MIDSTRSDTTGLDFPAHPAALQAAGAAFLTHAFRAFGAIGPDNHVSRIVRLAHCPGGSIGQKLFLTVDYACAEPGLHRELFVKFSRDFTDARRDHGRFEMADEARFAAIARLPGFPIAVPKSYCADYHRESGTGLLITERIGFGEGGIEPHRRKCLDHLTLADPLPHYRAIVTALARLAGAHKAGRLVPDVDRLFVFDPATGSADAIRHDAAGLRRLLAEGEAFAARCPRLLPAGVRDPAFQAMLARDAERIRAHETDIRHFLCGDRDLIALCHWNAHIDNAWFERDAAGGLYCGLIDWGRVGQLTLGAVLWGCLSAAHHDIWDHHLDTLLALFVEVYAAHGGPRVSPDRLKLHLALHIATMGVARVLAFPEVILFRLPEAVDAAGPLDPMFEAVDPARNSLHVYTVFLQFWRRMDFGACLDRILAG